MQAPPAPPVTEKTFVGGKFTSSVMATGKAPSWLADITDEPWVYSSFPTRPVVHVLTFFSTSQA